MGSKRNAFWTVAFVSTGLGVGGGACDVDDVPCPGRCFAYTVEYVVPRKCQTGAGDGYDIPFTGSDPNGYHGRYCFNSSSVTQVMQAIEHLRGGGQLSDLGVDVQSAYISTVNAAKSDVQAECITAAPGQCTDEVQVCTGIAADMYEQLVVDGTCVLEPDGIEPVTLGPGQVCESLGEDPATSSDEAGEHCFEASTGDGVDETAGSGNGVDETSG